MRVASGNRVGIRFLGFVAGTLAAAALLLAWKFLFLPFVLHAPASRYVAYALFLVAILAAYIVARPPGALATLVALVVALGVLANVVNTPLAYELAHVAENVPLPPGHEERTTTDGSRAGSVVEVAFEATYPTGRNLTDLAERAVAVLQADGWNVSGVVLPGSDRARWGDLGYLEARDGPLTLTCTVGRGEGTPTIRCLLRA